MITENVNFLKNSRYKINMCWWSQSGNQKVRLKNDGCWKGIQEIRRIIINSQSSYVKYVVDRNLDGDGFIDFISYKE